jgi:hypothetical protein
MDQTDQAPERRLILVDLENLVGMSPREATTDDYRFAVAELVDRLHIDAAADRLIIGVNPALAFTAHDLCPAARIVTRTGPDGADERLCEELDDVRFIARRFDTVIVASGDHSFCTPIAALAFHHVSTVVAALPRHLSAALRVAAQQVVWLAPPPQFTPAAGQVAA